MKIVLTDDLFTNGEYSVDYGDKTATFSIIDESYNGIAGSMVIDRMICTVKSFDDAGELIDTSFASLVIGLGDELAGVTSDDNALRGKLLTKDNMASCTVELYE